MLGRFAHPFFLSNSQGWMILQDGFHIHSLSLIVEVGMILQVLRFTGHGSRVPKEDRTLPGR